MKRNMEALRTFFVSLFAGIAAYFNPIHGEIESLMIIFAFNFIAGLLCDLLVNRAKFRYKKAMRCFFELTCMMVFISAMFSIGERKNDTEGVLQMVSFVTYVVIWFYSQNILRNLKLLFKTGTMHNIFAFLYYIVSVEFVKRIPFLVEYFELDSSNNDKQ